MPCRQDGQNSWLLLQLPRVACFHVGTFIVLPYMHTIAHILKKVSSWYDVQVIFPAPQKLVVLCIEKVTCRAVMKGTRGATCNIKHVKKFF